MVNHIVLTLKYKCRYQNTNRNKNGFEGSFYVLLIVEAFYGDDLIYLNKTY